MKIELDIPIDEFTWNASDYGFTETNDVISFMDIIIDRAADKIIAKSYKSDIKDIDKALLAKLDLYKQEIEQKLTAMMSDELYKEIRNSITEKVINDVAKRYERSKNFNKIKGQLELKTDQAITNELRGIVSEMVKSEVRKMIQI